VLDGREVLQELSLIPITEWNCRSALNMQGRAGHGLVQPIASLRLLLVSLLQERYGGERAPRFDQVLDLG